MPFMITPPEEHPMTRITLLAAFVAMSSSVAAFAQTAPAPVAPAAPAVVAPAAKAPAVTTAPAAAPAVAKTEPTAEEKAARAKFRAACGADITKLCGTEAPVANATPEQMKTQRVKVRACLLTNEAKLSADCKTEVTEREAAMKAKKKS
jgi:hypothetical protein